MIPISKPCENALCVGEISDNVFEEMVKENPTLKLKVVTKLYENIHIQLRCPECNKLIPAEETFRLFANYYEKYISN